MPVPVSAALMLMLALAFRVSVLALQATASFMLMSPAVPAVPAVPLLLWMAKLPPAKAVATAAPVMLPPLAATV